MEISIHGAEAEKIITTLGIPPIAPIARFRNTGTANDPLACFRAMCKEVADHLEIEPIRAITAVGAIVRNNELSAWDQKFLERILNLCADHNVPVARDFTLTALNIHDDQAGDALKLTIPADIFACFYVYNGPDRQGRPAKTSHERQSDLHHVPGAWYQAAEKCGARIIVTFGADPKLDVTQSKFAPPVGVKSIYQNTDIKLFHHDVCVLVREDLASQLSRATGRPAFSY
jgi:hypothetical protein